MSKKSTNAQGKLLKLGITAGVALFLLVFFFVVFFTNVDNGFTGVRYSWLNGGVKDETTGQGLQFKGADKIIQYPIKTQTIQVEGLSIATSDGKKSTVNVKYDYNVQKNKASAIYREFNSSAEELENGWLKSKLQKATRDAYSDYSILEVLSGKNGEVEGKILKNFQKSVEEKGFIVTDVTAGIPDVDKETADQIDAIIRAGQENEKAKLESETKKTKADASYYEKVKSAEAEADSNKKINDSISENLIKWEEAKGIAEGRAKYGELRTITGGGEGVIIDDK